MSNVAIKLPLSICTDTPVGADLFRYGDEDARHLLHTGIERNGGLTPIYEKETTFATAGISRAVARDGTVIQVDAGHNVLLDGLSIGNVGPHSVTPRGKLPGYSDAAWTPTNTLLAISRIGQTMRVDEYDPATGTIINTRSTTFAMPTATITNIVLVKYVGIKFADSLKFILSNNSITYLLNETGAAINIVGGIAFTVRTLEANTWYSITWSPQLSLFVAVGAGGTHYAATSPDGITWTTRTLAANTWASVTWSPQLSLFVAVGVGGTNYAATSPDGITWTTRTLAANLWLSITWSPQLSLFVAVGDGGTNYAATSPDGITWTTRTLAANTWRSVTWSPQLSLFVAVGLGVTNYAATSPDGITWTTRTLAANNWFSVTWSPQLSLFVAVGNGVTNYAATSPDGITWTVQTLAANDWHSVTWSPQLSLFVAVGVGGTNYAATGSITITNSSFAWEFSAGNSIIGRQGSAGTWYIGNLLGTPAAIVDSTWCVIDIFKGTAYSQAVLTYTVKKNAANLLTGISTVGYSQAGVYSATPTAYGIALGAVTVTIGTSACGPGYSEATFTRSDTGTAIFYYLAPIMGHQPGQLYDYQQSQTQTLCNGYGRLTDFNNNTLGNTCSLRVVMISGVPSLLSAAPLGQTSTSPLDCIGVPITGVGEFDEYFVPHVVDNGTTRLNVVYRYNGILFFFSIQSGVANEIQKVSDDLYTVNTLSAINAIDIPNRMLTLGTNDYNGRILFRSAAAIIATVKAVGVIQGTHANSIDTGEKLITQTFSTVTNIVPGIELPSYIDRAVSDYGINIYLSSVYSVTYVSFNITTVNSNFALTVYVADTRIPYGMGYQFQDGHTQQTDLMTIFGGVGVVGRANVDYDYLCYELGNEIAGSFRSFTLFAQSYIFDGNAIWLATFNGSMFSGRGNSPVAIATGMQLVASAPTEIYFLSAFDNSIYVYNGGRELVKLIRMNQQETIIDGVFNVRDDTLLLNTATRFLWIRDGVISDNPKKAAQVGIGLYDTVNGIVIANLTQSWQYTFFALAGSTVVPFVWQSGYHGIKDSKLGLLSAWYMTLYSAAKTEIDIDITVDSFDADGPWHQDVYFKILPSDWDSLGFWRSAKIVPERTLTLGASVGLKTEDYMVLNQVDIEYTPDATVTPRAERSR